MAAVFSVSLDLEHYYRVLELEPWVPQHRVRRAYRRLIVAWHPDRFTDRLAVRRTAEEKAKAINEAYRAIRMAGFPTAPQEPPANVAPAPPPSEPPSSPPTAPPSSEDEDAPLWYWFLYSVVFLGIFAVTFLFAGFDRDDSLLGRAFAAVVIALLFAGGGREAIVLVAVAAFRYRRAALTFLLVSAAALGVLWSFDENWAAVLAPFLLLAAFVGLFVIVRRVIASLAA